MNERQIADPATRIIDTLGRQWTTRLNGSLGVIGADLTVDSFAQLEAMYGPCEVLG